MSDSLMIEATGEDYDHLYQVFLLAPEQSYSAVALNSNQLVFYEFSSEAQSNFPFPMPVEICAEIAKAWLIRQQPIYGTKPDIDGDLKKGWRLCASSMENTLTVSPHWMIYHK